MSSNKQKRLQIAAKKLRKWMKIRTAEKAEKESQLLAKAAARGLVAIDRSKLTSHNTMGGFSIPTLQGRFYIDFHFICRDCKCEQVWTGSQQKWWFEEKGGEIEATAIRCLECRVKERARKAEARRIAEEGKARKKAEREKGHR